MSRRAARVARQGARLAAIAGAWALTGCAVLGGAPATNPGAVSGGQQSDSAPTAARPPNDAGAASATLLSQSRTERAAGNLSAASASAERALRIDPNNPAVWLELGEIELANGDGAQAATMARKALTLSGGDPSVEAHAERLLHAAAP